MSFADYVAGRDPAVDPIVQGKDVRGLVWIAASDGAASAYAAYEERKVRWGADPTWSPPNELDLRTVMRELDDAGRAAAAIEVATLNTRINPHEWRTWMNLGDILLRSGRKAEAIDNYRKSLALDDPTNFNTERLKRAVQDFEKETGAPARPASPSDW